MATITEEQKLNLETLLGDIRARAGTIAEQAAGLAEKKGKTEIASSLRSTARELVSSIIPFEDVSGQAAPLAGIQEAPVIDTTNIGTVSAGADGLSDFQKALAEQLERIEKEQEAAKTEQKGLIDTLKAQITARPSVEETRADALRILGLPEDFTAQQFGQLTSVTAEVTALNQQLTALTIEEKEEIARLEERPGLTNIAERTSVERKFARKKSALAAEIGARTATAQLLRGNISLAQNAVTNTVNALMFETVQERADLEFFIDRNQDFIDALDVEERNLIIDALDSIKDREKNERQDFRDKLNLITTAASQGVDLGLSIEQIKTISLVDVLKTFETLVGGRIGEVSISKIITGAIKDISGRLERQRGIDGFVSPQEYQRAKDNFVTAGGSLSDFKNEFPAQLFVKDVSVLPKALQPEAKTILELLGFGGGAEANALASIGLQVMCTESGGTWNPETNTCDR